MYRRLTILLAGLIVLSAVTLLSLGCPRGLNLRQAPTRRAEPTISVYFHENNTKREMPIEEYLAGVVAGEMEANWPENAYAAQAILARTFTMEFIGRGGTKKLHATDICTDEKHAQAYTTSRITPAIKQAVAATKGQVLLYKGKYIRGWFSASCGGRTALSRAGLAFKGAEPPYISSVDCPEGKVIPKDAQLWQARFSGGELEAALKKATGKSVGTVTTVEGRAKDGLTHRTTKLRLTGASGTAEVAAADFRVALGPERMRSIWLTGIQSGKDGTTMSGRGFGHGVGLCQWGAHALAKEGRNPTQIAQHYFPKAQIAKMW